MTGLPSWCRPLQTCHHRHIFALIESLLILYYYFLIYSIYQSSQFPPPSSLPAPCPHLPFISPLLFLHSEKGSPPMGIINKAWHNQLRQDQAPPSSERLGKAIRYWESVLKMSTHALETGLASAARISTDSATLLSRPCRGPASVPRRLPSCWSRVHELPLVQVGSPCGSPVMTLTCLAYSSSSHSST